MSRPKRPDGETGADVGVAPVLPHPPCGDSIPLGAALEMASEVEPHADVREDRIILRVLPEMEETQLLSGAAGYRGGGALPLRRGPGLLQVRIAKTPALATSPFVLVYALVDDSLSPTFPLGDAIETFIRREDAERFIEEVRADDSELASYLRIQERELDAGALD